MATIHASPLPSNMVPTIPSGALPQTPLSEWSESTTDLLAGHVTRTPVGTPGPPVPGGFPAHLEPDSEAVSSTTGNADADAGAQEKELGTTLLETAQATLAAATAYLPSGLASYFPSNLSKASASPSESSLPPLPPSSASLGSTLPRKDTTSAVERLDSTATASTADSAALSTTVHTGHSSSAIPPADIAKPPRPTSGMIASHPGVAADPPQLVQSPTSMSVKSLPSPAPPQPTEGMKPSHPGVSSSPSSPPASTPSAAARASGTPTPPKPTEGMKPSHPGVDASRAPAPTSSSSPAPPKPTEGMKPSHPGVDSSRAPASSADPASNVHTLHLPTHIVHRGPPHPMPHAPPTAVSASSPRNDVNADASQTSSLLAASTPSLVPSDGDSGYAASTESGTPALATPTDSIPPLATPPATNLMPGEGASQATPIPPPMHIPSSMAGTVADVVASADAGGSPRLADDVLEPSALSPVRAPDVNSSSPLSPLRRSDVVSSISSLGSGVQAPTSTPRMPDSARVPTGDSGAEGDVDEPPSSSPTRSHDSGDADDAGDDGKNGGKKSKRGSKLLQKLKEKMHVGSGSS